MLELRLLGPVEALVDGQPVALPAKQRAVLAALALDLGRPVSTDRLVDILWDERPPEQAVKTLQVYVSDGNPPSGVASGYVWFDVMALLVAPWLVYVAGGRLNPKRWTRSSGALVSSIRRREPIGTMSASGASSRASVT